MTDEITAEEAPPPIRPPLDPSVLISFAQTMRVDAFTAQVVAAMHAVGIRPVLLKGPVLRQWLYADQPQQRMYLDADLFVAPEHQARAGAVLEELGFVCTETPVLELDLQNRAYSRPADGANVDLHGIFHGLQGIDRDHVWRVISTHLTPFALAGQSVDAPDPALRTLLVVLHLAAHESAGAKAWRDLSRALDQVDRPTWVEATDLARELGAEVEMAVRLRRLPAGAELADALGLPSGGDSPYWIIGAVSRGSIPEAAVALHRLRSLRRSPRQAGRYVLTKLFPPRDILERDFPQLSRYGTAGVVAARIAWIWSVAARLPAALDGYRRYRKPGR
jgi:hypothetical protein